MKKYPFSVQKHAHDIELYRNYLFNTMYDMESGKIPMDKTRYERMSDMRNGALMELYDAVIFGGDGRVAYLTGAQIGLANKIIAWARERRIASLISAGKDEYIQYC